MAIIYLNNKYGVDVKGKFEINTNSDNYTSGSGEVNTEHFQNVEKPETIKVSTGEKYLKRLNKWGIGPDKTKEVETGKNLYPMDEIFKEMINNYKAAYARFIKILEND